MKKKSIVTTTGVILLTCSFISLASDLSPDDDIDLEPCMNGGVSATGLYETQALEDAASNNATINGSLGHVGK